MDALLNLSKEERIALRRTRIKEKLNATNVLAVDERSIKENDNKNDNKNERISESTSIERFFNDTQKNDIIKELGEKKEDLINNLSSEISKREEPFLEYIKKFENTDDSLLLVHDKPVDEIRSEQIDDSISGLNKFDSKNNLAEIHNLSLKEKETYSKKIEKYFSLLQYRDERIQEVCQMHSTNFLSLINLMKHQMEGYKLYLEGIYNKTRDKLIEERKNLLNANKKVLDDYLKFQNLNFYEISKEIIESEQQLNEKTTTQEQEYNSNIELKSDLLKKKLDSNINFVKSISCFILDKEKNIYDGKILMQKNNYNLKMINYYKLEINKLREALLSVKTHYYNYKMKSKKMITELISQYERIKFQFIELQKRQKNYEQHFQSKYAAAWELQRNEVNKYIEKLITANKIIHEEIFLTKFEDNNYKSLIEENVDINVDSNNEDEHKITSSQTKKVTEAQVEHVKKLLLQECAFLIDDADQNETDEEKIKHILKYIGVHNQKNMELLTQLFYIENEKEDEKENEEDEKENEEDEKEKEEDEKEKEEITTDNRSCVSPEYTLDIISKYCKEKEKEVLYKITKGTQKYTNRLNISLKLTIEKKKNEKQYWDRLSNIISEEMIELWKRYFDILKDRANVIDNICREEKQAKEYIRIIKQWKEYEKK